LDVGFGNVSWRRGGKPCYVNGDGGFNVTLQGGFVMTRKSVALLLAVIFAASGVGAGAEGSDLPKEVRGYKVERAKVKTRKQKNSVGSDDVQDLVTFGTARVESVGPLEVMLEVPVTIAPVQSSGEVELLVFEGVEVNGIPVSVEDYKTPFSLPQNGPLTLSDPIRLRVSTTQALLGTIGEILGPSKEWPVKGRVYVCGRYRKFLLSFKRAIPVELKTSIQNPLGS
jgi:hypothetical protein